MQNENLYFVSVALLFLKLIIDMHVPIKHSSIAVQCNEIYNVRSNPITAIMSLFFLEFLRFFLASVFPLSICWIMVLVEYISRIHRENIQRIRSTETSCIEDRNKSCFYRLIIGFQFRI